MVVIFLLLGAAVFAWPVVSGLTSSTRERDRRLRYVAQHPDRVNAGDICRLLARELDRDDVDMIVERAEALGIKPWTMYSWIQRFDVATLAIVIAAELSHEELLGHLANETMPDLHELQLFAAINGLPAAPRPSAARPAARAALAGPVRTSQTARTAKVWTTPVRTAPTAAPAPAVPIVEATGSTSAMPQIFEPGSWPYDQFGSDLPEWPDAPDAPGEPGPLAA